MTKYINWFRYTPRLDVNLALVTLFFVSWLLSTIFSGYDFRLKVPDGVYFSEAVFEGIDVGKRVSFFYNLMALAAILSLVVYFGGYHLFRSLKIKPGQSDFLGVVSVTGFFCIISGVIGWDAATISHTLFFILLLKIFLYALANTKQGKLRYLGVDSFGNLSLISAYLLYQAFIFFFNSKAFIDNSFLVVYPLLSVLTVLVFFSATANYRIPARKLFIFVIPLSLIPLLIFFSAEMVVFLKLKFDYLLRFKVFFAGLLLLCFVLAAAWIFGRKKTFQSHGILELFFIPSVIVSIILAVFYNPFPPQSTEIFELANPANSMLRIFAFGQIPFIDYMSSHMFSEQWYGIIYHLIYGFENNLDFLIYEFFNRLILVFIMYYLLNQLFESKMLALVFIATFSFLFGVFFSYISLATVLFFIINRVAGNQTTKNYIIFFATILLLIVWRLDTGSAGLITSFLYFVFLLVIKHTKLNWRTSGKATGIILVFVIVSLIIAFSLTSVDYIADNFRAALHYIKANQAHGFSLITSSYTHQFYIYHFIFPVISLAAIFVVAVKLWKSGTAGTHDKWGLASVFFYFLYIANAQRGLVRHSFYEGSDMFLASTFFISSALFITFIVGRRLTQTHRYSLFYAALFLVFVMLKFYPLGENVTLAEQAITKSSLKNFDTHFIDGQSLKRTQPDEVFISNMYLDFKNFLDQNLKEDQTFLDFSNTPMLYYYCGRAIPGYFNQNLQNTVDDYLQLHLLKYLEPHRVPVVVFSNYPVNWFDATDGVPNVMRYYHIAEYIFSNYRPLGIISNKSIWVARNQDFISGEIPAIDYAAQVEQYNYQKAAYFTGQYYKNEPADYLEGIFQIDIAGENPESELVLDIPENIHKEKNVYLQVWIDSENQHEDVTLSLWENENLTGRFTFDVVAGKEGSYMLRPGNHYRWFLMNANKIVIQQNQGIQIRKVVIFKDHRIENDNSDIH